MVANREKAISILEAAMFTTLLLVLTTGVVAVWDYLALENTFRSVAEKSLSASNIKTFQLNFDDGPLYRLELNNEDISHMLIDAVLKTQLELQDKISYFRNTKKPFYLEACFCVININSANGHFEGVERIECPAKFGDTSLINSYLAHYTLSDAIQKKAQNSGHPFQGQNLNWVSDNNNQPSFLPKNVVVGLRICADLKNTAVALAASLFQNKPFIYHDHIITLRGDVS
ncbi:MAG: hypothetical protein GYA55_05360 [SAR324 cluster bacterium]|uniref:Uncharacterized protein n=1 Tax=SAR324 cluster bacterium TaxID=2024889 RepID=A0A7X9IL37_9DELT|nr:hypothetical protein [SAR324 cluster bacterium]